MDREAWQAIVHRVTESDMTRVTKHAHVAYEDMSAILMYVLTSGLVTSRHLLAKTSCVFFCISPGSLALSSVRQSTYE